MEDPDEGEAGRVPGGWMTFWMIREGCVADPGGEWTQSSGDVRRGGIEASALQRLITLLETWMYVIIVFCGSLLFIVINCYLLCFIVIYCYIFITVVLCL